MGNLAVAYQASGQLAKAVPLLEATLEKTKAKLGAEHPGTLGTMAALGSVLRLGLGVLLLTEQCAAERRLRVEREPIVRNLFLADGRGRACFCASATSLRATARPWQVGRCPDVSKEDDEIQHSRPHF
jgi:hypothetical protein